MIYGPLQPLANTAPLFWIVGMGLSSAMLISVLSCM